RDVGLVAEKVSERAKIPAVVAHVLAVVGPVRLSFRAIEDLPEVRTKPVEQRVEGRVVNWPPAGGPQLRHALSNRELRHAAHREPPKTNQPLKRRGWRAPVRVPWPSGTPARRGYRPAPSGRTPTRRACARRGPCSRRGPS